MTMSVKRIVNFKILGEDNVNEIKKFERLVVVNGIRMFDALLEMVKEYNLTHQIDFTPLKEGEVINALRDDGFNIMRMTLRKYRDQGHLEDENGPFWFTDGTNFLYNYEKVRDFVERRLSGGWKLPEPYAQRAVQI